jgi:hypothetical protein
MDPVDPDPDSDPRHCFYNYMVLFGKTYCDVHYLREMVLVMLRWLTTPLFLVMQDVL